MQKIKILDKQEAIKIAAGEVVERPAHILKELIENSIDAGATHITIHTKQAGKKEIIITDNGSGMSAIDAKLCFAHHATSKITTVNDLDSISTYGFRGEALSSIASVARVELITKTIDDKAATQIIIHDGSLISEQTTAHPTGTTLKITNLFDAIPARKKFLKSDDTEWNAIVSIFQAFCLRYPEIHFKLFHDNKLSYNCPSSHNLIQKTAGLWDGALHEQLLEIEPIKQNNIKIYGATSKPHHHRYNRNQMFIFVNNRWIKNIELYRAIMKGYQNVLPTQKYPTTFLCIDIDPKLVDINIHPKKEEIKFLHPGIVQKFVQETITTVLTQNITKTFNPFIMQPSPANPKQSLIQKPLNQPSLNLKNQFISQVYPPEKTVNLFENIEEKTIFKQDQSLTEITTSQTVTQQPFIEKIYEQEPYRIIGQVFATYIMIEQGNEIIMIDQHAAHERILYESFKNNFNDVASVQLLFPHIITLCKSDLDITVEYADLFKQHGIIFEPFNDTQLLIQATPVHIQQGAVQDIIESTLQTIKQSNMTKEQDLFKKIHESIHTQKACKGACKAGDNLSTEQMNTIVQTLQKTEQNFCCPHGRPTMWNLTLKEVEKFFKRDYKSLSKNLFV